MSSTNVKQINKKEIAELNQRIDNLREEVTARNIDINSKNIIINEMMENRKFLEQLISHLTSKETIHGPGGLNKSGQGFKSQHGGY